MFEDPSVISSIFGVDYQLNVTVIPNGTTVQILGVRCDRNVDCWDGIDEKLFCGFDTSQTVEIGKQLKNLEARKGLLYKSIISLTQIFYFNL